MSAKKRNHPRSLVHLDPATRAALQDAARRSGMALEDWLAAAAADSASRAERAAKLAQAESAKDAPIKAGAGAPAKRKDAPPAAPEPAPKPAAPRARPGILAQAVKAERQAAPQVEAASTAPRAARGRPKKLAVPAQPDPALAAPASSDAQRDGSPASALTGIALAESLVAEAGPSPEPLAAAPETSADEAALVWGQVDFTPAAAHDIPPEPASAEAAPEAGPGEPAPPPAAHLDDLVQLMARRLDEIERKVEDGSKSSAMLAIEKLEARVSQLGEVAEESVSGKTLEHVLGDFEDRLGQIAERIARTAPRPMGRRGADPRDEILNAVAEIRARQRDLDDSEPLPLYASRLRSNARPAPAEPAIAAVQTEIERLRESIANLATRDEVGAIECSLRDLGYQLSEARGPQDLQAMTAPIEDLQAEIRSLADLVSTGVHGKLASDLERLVRKIDHVPGADAASVGALIDQLSDAQQALMEMAEPRRVQSLVEQVTELNAQLADIRSRQVDAYEFASLKSAVEEIRTTLKSPRFGAGPAPVDFTPHFEKLARKLDTIGEQTSFARLDAVSAQLAALAGRMENAGPDRVATRLDELARKIDGFGQVPERAFAREMEKLSLRIESAMAGTGPSAGMDRVLSRLDRLDDSLRRRPAAPELKPLEDMVRSLADKLDHAGRPGAGLGALDALEKQIVSLAQRLERSAGRNPALQPLEESMGDLMNQVESLREGAPGEHASNGAASAARESEFELLKRELAEVDARAAAERAQAKPEALKDTLDAVVSRLATLEGEAGERGAAPSAHAGEALRAAAVASRAEAGGKPAPWGQSRAEKADEADQPVRPAAEEILLEPGAGRPRVGDASSALAAKLDADAADIKASFIAAARRAAQAAAAEAAAKPKSAARNPDEVAVASTGTPASLSARVRTAIDRRRRPLLLGLAAIVLAIGAVQVVGPLIEEGKLAGGAESPRETASAALNAASAGSTFSEGGAGDGLDPRTTQSIPAATAAAPSAKADGALASARDGANPLEAKPAPESKAAAEPAKPSEPGARPGAAPQAVAAAPDPAAIAPPDAALSGDRIANIASIGEIPQAGIPAPLRAAALAGEPNAVYELATRLAEGRGVPRDPKLAAKLFERAALHGLAPAQYRIGNHYEKGFGVARDLTLAKLWYQRAAEKGNARAMHNLGVLLADGSTGRPDYAGAAGWFRRAAELGVRDSQFNLGVLLARGLGGPQDLGQSYTWFSVAAAQGDVDSAKKREEVAARMAPHDAAAARAAAERWRAETLDKAANEVAPAPSTWTEAPVKRPAGSKV